MAPAKWPILPLSNASHFSNINCVFENFFLHRKTCDKFWPLSKSCHFSNISYFLEPFFAQNNSSVTMLQRQSGQFCHVLKIVLFL